MATNQYLAFAIGVGANTLSAAAWAADPDLSLGFQAGLASATKANTAWRQTTVAVAALAQFCADNGGGNMLDDGNVANFEASIKLAIQALIDAVVPPGAILDFPYNAVPSGWVWATGQVVSQTGTYARLFAKIGTTYNTGGEGAGNFRLPDYRGVARRGYDGGRGLDPARVFGSFQDWATGTPKTTAATQLHGDGSTSGLDGATNPSRIGFARASKSGEVVTVSGVDAVGSGTQVDALNAVTGDPETRMVNMAVLTCIKL